MGKSQETYNKKEKEKKRLKKRKDKAAKKEERKANPKRSGLENMISYVDEYGNFSDTPPDPANRIVFKAEDIDLGVPKREKEEVNPIRTGKVEFFNSEKGFGFIKENDTNEKFFVHVSSLTEEIAENDKVTFELEQGLKGLNAVRVNKVWFLETVAANQTYYHKSEKLDPETFIGIAMSQGGLEALLKRGFSEKEIGIDQFRNGIESIDDVAISQITYNYQVLYGIK